MFDVGDAVVHPTCGAGVVVGFTEYQLDGSTIRYYDIELICEPGSNLMIPVVRAKEIGLRPVVSESRLKKVWRTLRSSPDPLPDDHKVRYCALGEKLDKGVILRIAEVVRDLAGRWQERNQLTAKEKRFYERAKILLAAEIAAVQSTEIEEAQTQIKTLLQESQSCQMAT